MFVQFFVGLQLMLTEQQIQIRILIYREKLSDFRISKKLSIQKMNLMLMSHVARVHWNRNIIIENIEIGQNMNLTKLSGNYLQSYHNIRWKKRQGSRNGRLSFNSCKCRKFGRFLISDLWFLGWIVFSEHASGTNFGWK